MAERGYAHDEQDLWIAQASKNVKKSAFYMRKAIVSVIQGLKVINLFCPAKPSPPVPLLFFNPDASLLKSLSTAMSLYSCRLRFYYR
jgi:hypothetical protein